MKYLVWILMLGLSVVPASGNERTWTNSDGQTMQARLVSVQADSVVFSREGRTYDYPIANLSEADQEIVREFAEEDKKGGVVAGELTGQLVRTDRNRLQSVSPGEIGNKRLFAFYYSAGWCPPCRAFTPDLVDFYEEVKGRYPEFEVVFISSDRDSREMEKYIKDYGMTFPAVRFDRKNNLAVANRYKQTGIPNLVFLDGAGKVISQSYVDGRYLGPQRVLRDIRQHLATK